MGDALVFILTFLAALGSGLVSGVFFAFSTFVMKALTRLDPGQGLAAMQSINKTVLNPWFLGVFLGTGAIALAAMTAWLYRWHGGGAVFALIGGAFYLLGTVVVTTRFNVPRNMSIASIGPDNPDRAHLWADYAAGWTRWNHIRTAAAFIAAAAFTIALVAHVATAKAHPARTVAHPGWENA